MSHTKIALKRKLWGAIHLFRPELSFAAGICVMAFFIDLGEEIAADAMDIDGDKKRNSKSIAIKKPQYC